MSNWAYLNKYRVRDPVPANIPPQYGSDDSYGFNGMFRLPLGSDTVRCVASDGSGIPDDPAYQWKHVSVSVEGDSRPPKWAIMCNVKDLFWEPEDWVVQFHPAKEEYVNLHPGCLHLWQPLVEKLPTPLAVMVGPKNKPL